MSRVWCKLDTWSFGIGQLIDLRFREGKNVVSRGLFASFAGAELSAGFRFVFQGQGFSLAGLRVRVGKLRTTGNVPMHPSMP